MGSSIEAPAGEGMFLKIIGERRADCQGRKEKNPGRFVGRNVRTGYS